MAVSAVPSPLPSQGVHRSLFDGIFHHSDEYRHWKREDTTWQLRAVGGPGCGKSIFASLVVEDLERGFQDSAIAILAVSFVHGKRQVPGLDGATDFLNEICKQLDEAAGSPPSKRPPNRAIGPTSQNAIAQDTHDSSVSVVEGVRSSIVAKAVAFRRVFLVVDDLDLHWASPDDYLRVEDELRWLQDRGVKIMTTSRVPFCKSTNEAVCDVEPEEHQGLGVWWQCQACIAAGYMICDECKMKGHGCRVPEHGSSLLVQPRMMADLDIGNIPKPIMEHFISLQLQREHGDLGLLGTDGSKIDSEIFPPLSRLGLELSLKNHAIDSGARLLVKRLAKQADGNISMALFRLETVHAAESFEVVDTIADRLPANIVAAFGVGINSIWDTERGLPEGRARNESGPGLRRNLGLSAIRAVGIYPDLNGMPFRDLKKRLLAADPSHAEEIALILDSEYGLEAVLGASAGFLAVNNTAAQVVRCFHPDFYRFVHDNYNEHLAAKKNPRLRK